MNLSLVRIGLIDNELMREEKGIIVKERDYKSYSRGKGESRKRDEKGDGDGST